MICIIVLFLVSWIANCWFSSRKNMGCIEAQEVIYDGWKSLLFSWMIEELCWRASLRRLFVIIIHIRNKDVENFWWLYAHTRKRLWLEKRRRRRQYRGSNDAQAGKRRNRIDTVPMCVCVCVCMFAWLSFSSLSFYFFSRSLSLFLHCLARFFYLLQQLFFHGYDMTRNKGTQRKWYKPVYYHYSYYYFWMVLFVSYTNNEIIRI
jgi:hypothetical protein